MGLKCRGEVLKAGKYPGCRTRVLSRSIPSCFPRPCAEVGRELCHCQVLDLCLPGGVQSFCGQFSLEKISNTAHLPASSSLNLSPKGCAHSRFPTACYHLQCCRCKGLLSRLKSCHSHVSIPETVQEHPCWPCSRAHRQAQDSPRLSTDLNLPVLPAW